jgi:hypothetical protein
LNAANRSLKSGFMIRVPIPSETLSGELPNGGDPVVH